MMVPDAFAEALVHQSAGELRMAIARYSDAAKDGGSIAALVAQAQLHSALGEIVDAVDALSLAERQEPTAAEPKLRKAHILTSIGRDGAAIRCLQIAIRDNPDATELRVNLADVCQRAGWADVSYWAVRSLPEALPDWWARARSDSVLHFEELRDRTLRLLTQYRKRGPLDHDGRWQLALLLYALGRLRTAMALCQQLIQSTPDALPPHDLASRIIARQNGPAAALDYLNRLPPALQLERAFVERSIRYHNDLGDYPQVLALAGGRPDLAGSFDIQFCTAVALLWQQKTARLREHCRAWMQRSPAEVLPAGVILSLEATKDRKDLPPAAAGPVNLLQFWDKPEVPADVHQVFESWGAHHPELERTVFGDETAREFLREAIGLDALQTYDLCHHAAMKADFFRIAYLYMRGGLYVDADERCLRNMGELLLASANADIAAVRSGDAFGYLHNYFLGARQGSRPLEIALASATRDIQDAAREGRRPSIWEATGPGLITRAVGTFILEDEGRSENAVILLPLMQYRSLVANAHDLDYKRLPDANWQLT